MNFLLYLIILVIFSLVETNCKSIHLHEDFRSEFESSEGRALNHRHESKNKVSWVKLKPIIRQEMQHVRKLKGAESTTFPVETTYETPVENEENVIKDVGSVENRKLSLDSKPQITNKTLTDDAKSNKTLFLGGDNNMARNFGMNNTNLGKLTLNSTINKKDFPYNITSDIMNQSGDLVVFLALEENENKKENPDSNESLFFNEGRTITLEEISTTGIELLTGFQSKQSLIDTKLPNKHKSSNDKINTTNFTEDLGVSILEMKSGDDNVLLEITEETYTSDIAEMNTEKSEIVNPVETQKVILKNEDDGLHIILNENKSTDFEKGKNITGTNFTSTKIKVREINENSTKEKSDMLEIAVIKPDRSDTENIEPDVANRVEDAKFKEISSLKQSDSNCPDPGLCIFWFLTLDTCENDNDCHGSLICCMWGCSKMCMDADAEML